MATGISVNVKTGEATEVQITAEEQSAMRPTPIQAEVNRIAAIDRQIASIEAGQDRAVREAALGDATYLQIIENQIAALRAQR